MPLVGIGTLPTPFWPASVPLPPETGGRGHTSQGVGGWGGVPIPTRGGNKKGAYTVVLFICTYFVPVTNGRSKMAHLITVDVGHLFIFDVHLFDNGFMQIRICAQAYRKQRKGSFN